MAVVRKDETPFLWFGLMPTKEAVSPESIPHHFWGDAMLARAYMMVFVEYAGDVFSGGTARVFHDNNVTKLDARSTNWVITI